MDKMRRIGTGGLQDFITANNDRITMSTEPVFLSKVTYMLPMNIEAGAMRSIRCRFYWCAQQDSNLQPLDS